MNLINFDSIGIIFGSYYHLHEHAIIYIKTYIYAYSHLTLGTVLFVSDI